MALTDQPQIDPGEEDLYRIGTVAQLTRISVERLRAWERRYGLAPAHRAGKTRFYSKDQLDRLTKIKRLIDSGHPISSLADLTDEQLDERLATQHRVTTEPPKTGLIGPNLLVLEQQQGEGQRLAVCARWANMEAFERDQLGIDTLDAIVAQVPVLNAALIDRITAIRPEAQIVALYQFTTPKHLADVEELGVPALQWPAGWQDIEAAVASLAHQSGAAGSAKRRFSDEELIAIAASTLADETGSPQHLVELISRLNAFAEYAAILPDHASQPGLYRAIQADASQARAQLERALEALAMAEGLIATPEATAAASVSTE